MPDGERFIDTKTSSRTENFYSTLMHTLTHWTGHASRLAQDMRSSFGDQGYAPISIEVDGYTTSRLTLRAKYVDRA